MRIAFFVNDIKKEHKGYTTTRLALEALKMGHEIWYITADDFAIDPDDSVRARARTVSKHNYKTYESFLNDLKGPKAKIERISVDDLDILLLRSNPADDEGLDGWKQNVGILFGRIAMRRGVIVLNDPNGLAKATNKMYFHQFPEEVRPKTLITRDRSEIKDFADENQTVVLKPVQGSGGKNVFLVKPEDRSNINQMIDAISRDGYIIAQEYLKAAEAGDVRLFMVNGRAFKYKNKYAAFRRTRTGGDMRSNIHAGGTLVQAQVTDEMLRIVDIVRPKLVFDGMFMVGLDIVGDKLMEINVFSPGGFGSAQKFEKVNFSIELIHVLEQKAQYMKYYKRNFDNVEMATL
ncbi:MAG: glutathione synthetase [Pseudomonadota bacterium]